MEVSKELLKIACITIPAQKGGRSISVSYDNEYNEVLISINEGGIYLGAPELEKLSEAINLFQSCIDIERETVERGETE